MNPFLNTFKARHSVATAGDTGTASVINLFVDRKRSSGKRGPKVGDFTLGVKVVNNGTLTNSTNATIAATAGTSAYATVTSNKEYILSSSASAQATGTLTISGVAKHGETVTVGSRVYEFRSNGVAADSPRVTVSIASNTVAAQGTLTMDTQPTANDNVTVGTRTYTWVASGTADHDGEISIGANVAAAKVNFVAAINGTDDVNEPNDLVTAADFVGDDCVLTAIIKGTAGNSYVTTETFTAGSNVFDAGTLGTTTAGTDCSAANAVTALVSAINGDASAVVGAADGAGDTVVITADTAGTDGNSLASTETMANGSFGASTLSGGAAEIDGCSVTLTDTTAETVQLLVYPAGPKQYPFEPLTVSVTHAAP